MSPEIRVRPGEISILQAKAGIVVTTLFLIFGIVFGFVVLLETPSSEFGMKILIGAFFCIWVVVCLGMIVMYARILSKQKPSLVDVDIEQSDGFGSRLQRLKQLKKEGLITEAEYQSKREQILQEI